MSNKLAYKERVKPHGKGGRREYAGQRIGGSTSKGGSGKYNWGSAMDVTAPFMQDEPSLDAFEDPIAQETFLQQMRNASIVQDKAQAARLYRQGSADQAEAQIAPASAWGQSTRVEQMKARLLALERERISQMEPDRVELLSILAECQVTLDEGTIEALLSWKRHG
eukprot:CAMPEP_0118968040 /NCGR_PEP_ID=MMETSP1173-20130426/5332_1 /TAXON_ID=1034831 /ORGANISM="Rhizochromulina marina cf, Strain CCMP1243" /LENGTH=165 /DNA_ID=CAMNT_0006917097 /DNA_START=146 /DNA_END=643 /DNA_ORIENTATION=+